MIINSGKFCNSKDIMIIFVSCNICQSQKGKGVHIIISIEINLRDVVIETRRCPGNSFKHKQFSQAQW